MSVQVPSEILDQTDKCWRDSTCLIEGKSFCEVWYSSGALNILFLRDTPPPGCPYRLHFGTAYVCRCPTHYCLTEHKKA